MALLKMAFDKGPGNTLKNSLRAGVRSTRQPASHHKQHSDRKSDYGLVWPLLLVLPAAIVPDPMHPIVISSMLVLKKLLMLGKPTLSS